MFQNLKIIPNGYKSLESCYLLRKIKKRKIKINKKINKKKKKKIRIKIKV
jgi:hypothetical protein